MHSVDDELLEEAGQSGGKRRRPWLRVAAAAAACLCIATAGTALWRHQRADGTQGAAGAAPGQTSSAPQIANPLHSATEAELTALGYSIPVPESAQNVAYTLIDGGEPVPMAQATFLSGSQEYTCRALKTQEATDISGIYDNWSESLDWTVGTLELQLRQADKNAWVGWFSPEDGTQWCLSGETGDGLALLHTAQSIVETLGYEMAVAPQDAENVLYNACALDGLTVGETTFDWNGVHYAYRTASTSDTSENFADISGTAETYAFTAEGQVQWCPARLSYNEGGAGKIVWFDVVPGLLYSITMDTGASESALNEIAAQLFVPAQGDVG